ncbi:MAG: winged helix-turn-helix domain-containing tetratricopeptide repeat protein [Acidiferrobacterales bacterium]
MPDAPDIAHPPFTLGDWRVDPDSGRLSSDDQEIKLEPKVMALLVYLAQNPGKVVSREALEKTVWAGTVVGYDAVTSSIIKLRKALGDDSRAPRYIETVSKRGYRLIADVQHDSGDAVDAPVAAAPAEVRRPVPRKRTWAWIAVVVAGLVGLAFALLRPTPSPTGAGNQTATLLVLPFLNVTADADQQYFSNGITDDLISDLSRYDRLHVVARRSAYLYAQRKSDLPTIARELGVDYVLDGDVRRQGNKLRLNVQLIDPRRGINLWAKRFDRDTQDLFKVQDDIRNNILKALSITLTQAERDRESKQYTQDFAAYDLFLKGQAKLVTRASAADNQEAQQLIEQAIARDPEFARAYAALALVHADAYRFNWTDRPDATRKEALSLVDRALALDDHLPEAYWIKGYIELFLYRDHTQAVAMGERALTYAPRNPDAITVLAVTLAFGDDPQRAILLMQEIMRTNKVYAAQVPSVVALANLRLGKYNEALTAADKSLTINPTRIQGNIWKIVTLYRMGKVDDAVFQAAELLNQHPTFEINAWAARQPFKDPADLKKMVVDFTAVKRQL